MAMIFVFPLLYFLLALILLRPQRSPRVEWEPTVDVIVAARNEEQRLPECLEALEQLDYPAEKLRIWLVNDASTDGTLAVMERFASSRQNARVVNLLRGEKKKPGKAGALAEALAQSSGEIVCITDADCRPSPSWVRGLAGRFEPTTAVVGGLTLLQPAQTIGQAVQTLDWLLLLSAASAVSHLDLPISWVGNNLAFRRSAYQQIGGFAALPDTLVEDFALIQAVRRFTAHRCRFYLSPESVVVSRPAETLRELYFQRRRWSTGVRHAPPMGLLLMSVAFAAHASLVITFFYTPWAAALLAGKAAADLLLIRRAQKAANVAAPLRHFLYFELYFIFYTLVLPLLMLFDRRIRWKGDRYAVGRRS